MAAGPTLHIFPPVEEVNRRRESLDDLIRRSMDMRPSGPWPARNTGISPVTKNETPRSAGGLSPSDNSNVGIAITRDRSQSPAAERLRLLPPIEEAKSSPRENPFQNLPPIQVPKRNPSATRGTRPRRSSSVGARSRNAAGPSPAQRRAPSPGPSFPRAQDISPVSSVDATPSTATATAVAFTPIERDATGRPSNRSRVCVPKQSTDGGEVASITSPVNYIPQRHISNASSSRQPLQRHASSRSQRPERPPRPDQRHEDVQTPMSDFSTVSPSTTLVRNNSVMSTYKQWSPMTPQQPQQQYIDLPMRSMFPVFNHQVPFAQQAYRPQHVAPLAVISPDKIVPAPYSPGFDSSLLLPKKLDPVYITPAADLATLWATANGKMTAPDPKSFSLKMYRPSPSDAKADKITFGPNEDQPFYSLKKSHTKTEEAEDHELLVQRHHISEEDILPVSHMDLTPPPPPTVSKANRGSVISDVQGPAQHVATITPILATLHALDNAAKTPQAQTIALVDPNATSPAAARLAERAVAEATQRESSTLAWTATDVCNGKYELHHPSLGVFAIHTIGDIKSAVEHNVVKGQVSISIINPYASLSPMTGSPISAGSGASTIVASAEPDILARLDFQEDCMHIDAAAIQQLGNLYLIDVCVSTLLAVATAEAKRPADPGLVFAAPPPSLMSLKGATSKKIKAPKLSKEIKEIVAKPAAPTTTTTLPNGTTVVKPTKKTKKARPMTMMANSLGLGFEHLAEKEDLPRITKAILSLLGLSFKGAVYLVGYGVKILAAIVMAITRMAMKD